MPTPRTLIIGTVVAGAALVLTGCAEKPVQHGEVIDKRANTGRWIVDYEDVDRENCTTIRTSSFTTGRSGGSSSSGGKSGSSGRTRKTDTNSSSSGTSGGTQPGKSLTTGGASGTKPNSPSSNPGSTQPTKQCERQYTGRKESGRHWQDGTWELKLRDGSRTGWKKVPKAIYDDTDLHDRI
ncbi:hypothetical protein [Streptomyces sp. NPDC050485]|uniref:hypothetical protein n=1 Tax=Streptomyces sp. NPDC050485 TaxID=3365617 RepID=UPI00379BCF8E